MTLHSVIICSTLKKKVHFSKIFNNQLTLEERVTFEEKLILHTKVYWPDAVSDGCIRTLMIDDVFVVYRAVGGLMIIIAGVDDTDEMILADVMNCLVQVMSETLGEGHNENSIVDTENFVKLSICIDEMAPEGIIECLTPEIVLKQCKLKNL